MQVRQFPRHGSVHLKKKVNNDRGTPPMDGIDAPTIEGIFFFFFCPQLHQTLKVNFSVNSS